MVKVKVMLVAEDDTLLNYFWVSASSLRDIEDVGREQNRLAVLIEDHLSRRFEQADDPKELD
jgi:hypothetical protein